MPAPNLTVTPEASFTEYEFDIDEATVSACTTVLVYVTLSLSGVANVSVLKLDI